MALFFSASPMDAGQSWDIEGNVLKNLSISYVKKGCFA